MNIDKQIEQAEITVNEAKTILNEAERELQYLRDKKYTQAFNNMFNLESFAFNPVTRVVDK
jgi:DNA-directed RNA polymerase subunit F